MPQPQAAPPPAPLDAAASYARAGIPVLPLHLPRQPHDPQQPCATCRRLDCPALPSHPTGPLDQAAGARHLAHAARGWTDTPIADIATISGAAFDVVEVHGHLDADTVLGWLAGQLGTPGPVLAAGPGRLQLLAAPGCYQHDRYDGALAAVIYLPAGALVLLPPSRLGDGQPVTWLRPLDPLAGLPDGAALFRALLGVPANRRLADPAVYQFPSDPDDSGGDPDGAGRPALAAEASSGPS